MSLENQIQVLRQNVQGEDKIFLIDSGKAEVFSSIEYSISEKTYERNIAAIMCVFQFGLGIAVDVRALNYIPADGVANLVRFLTAIGGRI
ncbi:MAG TPA: hypothetical protein VG895_01155 [Patescibacteria group bacterium]|nr:hypothetical protein [Patescibacteria group bacterium]